MLQRLQDIGGKKSMKRIYKAFENKKAFIGFLTAGDPVIDKTVDYILDMEIQYDDENLNVYLIELYEQLNINSYEFDKMRTNYAFAKCMNMDQAVNLYDSLTENGKSDLVEVIKFDFPHLHDLARIHDTFEFESVDVITSTVQ